MGAWFLFLACAALLAGCGRHKPVVIGSGADAIDEGTVAHTHNPQVALYTLRPHSPAQVTVQFGPTLAYGRTTWTVSASPSHPAAILVAGMRGDTPYHLRAQVRFHDGAALSDADHIFHTGHYRASLLPRIAVQRFGPTQRGIEMLDRSFGAYQAIATDLDGNVLWAYSYRDEQSMDRVQFHRYEHLATLTLAGWMNGIRHLFGLPTSGRAFFWDSSMWKRVPADRLSPTVINPIKQLPNGDFIAVIGLVSTAPLNTPDGTAPPDTTLVLREFNLAGDTVRNLTIAELNRRLRAIHYSGPQLQMFHHDVTLLPNGHLIVPTNAVRVYNNLAGRPGPTLVLGDILVELDQNFNPVWTWSEFDHLDLNHHPIDFPDWTHSNAVLYSKDDGNLLVSMRTQDWIIKIDYRNGKGTGNVLWRLGLGGDFRLIGGTAPEDWIYGQHEPAFFSDRNAGVFDLGVMDNGYGRIMADGKVCGTTGAPACYSAATIFRINENAKTATILFRKAFPPALYSSWGGGVQPLPGNQIQVDLCSAHVSKPEIYDLTRAADPQVVWHMHLGDKTNIDHAKRSGGGHLGGSTNIYRAKRMGSLYPGVQW